MCVHAKKKHLTFCIVSDLVEGQVEILKWCTTNANEQEKCEEMAHYTDLQLFQFGKFPMKIHCIRVLMPRKIYLFQPT